MNKENIIIVSIFEEYTYIHYSTVCTSETKTLLFLMYFKRDRIFSSEHLNVKISIKNSEKLESSSSLKLKNR